MDLLKWRIWQFGFLKQAKFLVSTPQKAQKIILISESGVVSQELIPMQTGFVSAEEVKKAWLVLHNLKFQVKKNNEPIDQESVLSISERCYIPLDPLGTMKPKDREKLASLKDIARLRHAEAMAESGQNTDANTQLSHYVINGCFIILGILAVVTLIKGCG